ncbi:PQ-loop domain-containing transporter [Mycoplasma hafezii]|uniref:PQ-loop domain-containing transporter n=1 Tax=Mycoplasma hafezii TaxID=525886 RepID=UPI003CEDD16B
MSIDTMTNFFNAELDTKPGIIPNGAYSPYNSVISVFLVLTGIFIISLSLPQLFKAIKDKKTGDVNFLSFWIFHLGIIGWVVYGTTNPHNLYNVVAAEGIATFVNGIMTYLLYHYKQEFTRKQKLCGLLAVLATWVFATIMIALFIYDHTGDRLKNTSLQLITVSDTASTVMGYIFPAFTTLAFTPQLIQSFKTKNWQGVSIWLYVLYEVNNAIWFTWWILEILRQMYLNDQYGANMGYQSFIAGLTWQVICTILFAVQLGFTLRDKYLIKTGKKRLQA